ncbi:hypothetical protein N7539_007554 [Penicillium diatomitis]|uniref:Rhodopsin domain-containing protein n=1 Tax=Penicillium diatomitis TaxID=2819901 RepID=A0A9X0BP05_9EURO|nr:uncharacterized protein N7539_007554 [Penicillium diatomitis]KAJ5477410.1 hypothetical protein N7539_007554 [Penicillium diatomitis]
MGVTFPIVKTAQREVLSVALVFSILAVAAVCLRLLAHHLARKPWTPSDYAIIIACIFAVGLQSISITGVIQAGIGYDHVTAIAAVYGLAPITKLLTLVIPLQFLWVLSLSCTKVSILLLYLRIFPVTWVVWASRATMLVIILWAIATILAGSLICRPFAFNWDQTIPGGHCGNQVQSFTATGVINLITDVFVLIIPMPLLYKLQMATYKKATLIIVFGLGFVTCIISALRIAVLSSMDFADITYTIPRANIFSGVEPCLAVILASVPLMRPLLGRSAQNSEVTAAHTRKPSEPSAASTKRCENGFLQLEDNSSQLQLRPVGTKHRVGVLAQETDRTSEESMEMTQSSPRSQDCDTKRDHGISVKQEWDVQHTTH